MRGGRTGGPVPDPLVLCPNGAGVDPLTLAAELGLLGLLVSLRNSVVPSNSALGARLDTSDGSWTSRS